MGTVTTISHCVVKDGIAYEGSMSEIVHRIYTMNIDGGKITYKVKWYNEGTLSYSDEWEHDEMIRDAVKTLFKKLKDYGFRNYRNIGW